MKQLGFALLVLAVTAAGCGKTSPTGPTPPGSLRVTSVSPATGSTTGGTAIVITGQGFASGATVTVGTVAATDVVVTSATEIRAVAPAHAAGAVAVVVRAGSESATLSNGFTYNAPPAGPNTPPVINSIVAR